MRKLILTAALLVPICGAEPERVPQARELRPWEAAMDALDEVNAVRVARGLRPFVRDDGLTVGARNVAAFRAKHGIEGHTADDFAGLPDGARATASGCAAWEPGLGWGSCCTYENWSYAGAAWCTGRDGRRYMQLFVR
jgi:hypothetical protein